MEPLAPPGSGERPPARASLAVLGAGVGIGLATAGAAAGVWLYLAGPPKRVEVVVGRTSLPDLRDGVPSVVAANPSASPLSARPAPGSAAFVPAAGAETRTGSIRTIPLSGAGPAAPPPASGGAAPAAPPAASVSPASTSSPPAPTGTRTDAIAALLEPAPPAAPPKPAAAPRPQAAASPQTTVSPPSRAEPAARPDPVRPDDVAADRAALPAPLPPAAPARSAAVPKPETRPGPAQQAQMAPPPAARVRPAPAAPSPMPPPPSAVEEEDRVEVFGLKLPGFVPTGKRLKEAADQVGDAITGLPGRF